MPIQRLQAWVFLWAEPVRIPQHVFARRATPFWGRTLNKYFEINCMITRYNPAMPRSFSACTSELEKNETPNANHAVIAIFVSPGCVIIITGTPRAPVPLVSLVAVSSPLPISISLLPAPTPMTMQEATELSLISVAERSSFSFPPDASCVFASKPELRRTRMLRLRGVGFGFCGVACSCFTRSFLI